MAQAMINDKTPEIGMAATVLAGFSRSNSSRGRLQ